MLQASMITESPASSSPFCFKDHPIRTRIDNDQLWFVAKDVCAALDISLSGVTFRGFPKDWQGMMKFITPSGNQPVKVITEPAVYKLAFRSNKPEADTFTNWVASEVIPAIRNTGKFEVAQPALPSTITPSTAADRRPLDKLVKVWAQQSGTVHAQAWTQVNAHFNLDSVTQLPIEWIPDAIAFVQAKIDALATIEAKPEQEALPPSAPALPTHRKMYTDRMAQLDSLESRLLSFGCEARRAMQTFAHEYTKISEATFYELLYIRYTGKKVISGDPLVTPLTAMPYEAYQLMADSVERMRSAIRASKTANNFMANGVTGA